MKIRIKLTPYLVDLLGINKPMITTVETPMKEEAKKMINVRVSKPAVPVPVVASANVSCPITPLMEEKKKQQQPLKPRVSSFTKPLMIKSVTKEDQFKFLVEPKRLKRCSDNKARVSSLITPKPKIVEINKKPTKQDFSFLSDQPKNGRVTATAAPTTACRSRVSSFNKIETKKTVEGDHNNGRRTATLVPTSCRPRVSSFTPKPNMETKKTVEGDNNNGRGTAAVPTCRPRVSSFNPKPKMETKKPYKENFSDNNGRGTAATVPSCKPRVSSLPVAPAVATRKRPAAKEEFSFMHEPKRPKRCSNIGTVPAAASTTTTTTSSYPIVSVTSTADEKPTMRMAIEQAKRVLALKRGREAAIEKANRAVGLRKERESARASILAVKKSVDVEDKHETMKELRKLTGGYNVVMGAFDLEMFGLGLKLKKDDVDVDYVM
ncbi:hypothetical protein ACFE04_015475 [Oxalis oulophora]